MEELEELVYKVQNKDMDSFEKLIQNIRSDLYRIAQTRLDDIEDIIAAEKLISDGTFNNVNHATAVIKNDQRMGRQDLREICGYQCG